MITAVALRRIIPKQQLRQRIREDWRGRIPVVITAELLYTPSSSRAVSNVVRLLSIAHLAFLSHHTTVVGFKDDFPHQVKQAHGRSLENLSVQDAKASTGEANALSSRP